MNAKREHYYTNGLIRQYVSKGTYFEKVTKETIKEIQHKINRRPRTAKHITNSLFQQQ